MSEERYNQLVARWEANKRCRAPAVEEARLWCQAHKGTATLEEGLLACTPDELSHLAQIDVYCEQDGAGYGFPQLLYLVWEAVRWLNDRAEASRQAREEASQMPHIMPGDETDG